MPYLSRGAIENKLILRDGQAPEERLRAGSQIWKGVFEVSLSEHDCIGFIEVVAGAI